MKKIRDLYYIDSDLLVKDIKINSKEVEEGDIFICTMGVTTDRHLFVDEAVKNGAHLIVASKKINVSVPVKYVDDCNRELINLARKLYDFDDDNLDLIGITGTNGKTTVATMIKNLMGNTCGYMGTNGIISKSFNEKIRNTTPDADRLYKYFKKFTDDGCKNLAIETSSEAFFRHRLDTLKFRVGILTNITEDHLNIHKTIENYVDSKMNLFRQIKSDGYAILNKDDKYFELAKNNSNCNILSYGFSNADLVINNYNLFIDYTEFSFTYDNKEYFVKSPFIGIPNIYNLCASILTLITYGFDINTIIERINNIPLIDGRFQFLNINKPYKIMLDYAHTVDAFMNVLPFLNEFKGDGRLIIITGSAGGREKEKRGPMGKYVLENSDLVIFTMDDPRYENVLDIINDLKSLSNNENSITIEDRVDAIKYAIDNAKENDIILIAGKGTDNYMAIEDKYLPYSDYETVFNILNK